MWRSFVPCSIEFIFGSLRHWLSDFGLLWFGAYSTEQMYSFPERDDRWWTNPRGSSTVLIEKDIALEFLGEDNQVLRIGNVQIGTRERMLLTQTRRDRMNKRRLKRARKIATWDLLYKTGNSCVREVERHSPRIVHWSMSGEDDEERSIQRRMTTDTRQCRLLTLLWFSSLNDLLFAACFLLAFAPSTILSQLILISSSSIYPVRDSTNPTASD